MTVTYPSSKWLGWQPRPRSDLQVSGEPTRPKHEIQTDKIRRLGMVFGGETLLRHTIHEMVQQIQQA